ncbi:hypothetical protein NW762_009594 [Fusarium torreyae]|uniref:DUF1763-domain-containing protein n=1 Tax=Fusarium torreyae TaxID=1237075 RepID=A0A9W8RWF9_9HYPO|nr:hypothetical protein NW762_009594 [Fusarium torreyae]
MASKTQIIHTYRHMYRNLLRAVQHTSPARWVARDQIRAAFREPGAVFDEKATKRTMWFLEAAAKETGMEHRILKNLIKVSQFRYVRRKYTRWDPLTKTHFDMKGDAQTAYHHYDMTVAMLNKTMGLCLR